MRLTIIRSIHNTIIWPTHNLIGWISERAFNDEYVVATSVDAMSAYEETRKRFGLEPAARRKVIFNGVPMEQRPHRVTHAGPLKIAFFGRNAPQKGIDTLCETLNILKKRAISNLIVDLFTDATRDQLQVESGSNVAIVLHPHTKSAQNNGQL